MGNPLYRVRASGLGGSGYGRPPVGGQPSKKVKNADSDLIDVVVDDNGKPIIVPGVTTVNKASSNEGLIQWSVDQVAAYAVTNVDALLNRTEEQGFGFLRFYHKRKPDLTDPLRTAHSGVLNDLAELGTNIHDWIEADLDGGFYPEIDSLVMEQMVDAWQSFRFENDVESVHSELTVYGDGYAGTLDGWLRINGKTALIDYKSSRAIGISHKMQLAALREAKVYFVREGDTWVERRLEAPEEFGLIQIRPDDIDNGGTPIPRFVEYHRIPEDVLDICYSRFRNCLGILYADRDLKRVEESASV